MTDQTSSLPDLARRVLPEPAKRAARALRDRSPLRRMVRPTVSVILPIYNVEQYLGACLDSLAAQTFGDYEAIVVDDGSPDGSRAIAERYAADDRRIRVVTRPNGGLGAARNTGVEHARGRYLTFVDSDDLLPPTALAALVGSAEASGSDIVVGSVKRFDSTRSWRPQWVDGVHAERLRGVRIEEFLPLIRNLYTWDKLYRRDFWDAQGLRFREGVAYEDQPIVTQLFARARAIDVLTDVVYHYRARDDRSSISQQTATVKDLRDRIAAWEVSRETLLAEVDRTVYDGWLQTLFDAHFHWYLTSPGTADDTYWRELQDAVVRFTDDAPQHVWDGTPPAKRVLLELTRQDRRADAQEFVRVDSVKADRWPATTREDGVLLHLPFLGDPKLPEHLFLIRPEQLAVAHSVENFHWHTDPGEAGTFSVTGWAYLEKVDLAEHASSVRVVLRSRRTGAETSFPATGPARAAFAPPVDDSWCDYEPGTFHATVPLAEVTRDAEPGETWQVLLAVSAAGHEAMVPVTTLLRSGSAGAIPAATLPDGSRLVAEWRVHEPLRFRRILPVVEVADVSLSGRVLRGTLAGPEAGAVRRVVATTRGGARAEADPAAGRFALELPAVADLSVADPATWDVVAVLDEDRGVPLSLRGELPATETLSASALEALATRNGNLAVGEWVAGAIAESLEVTDDEVLRVRGRVRGPGITSVALASRHPKTQVTGPRAAVAGTEFEAEFPLRHRVHRFGDQPLPTGDHDFAVVADVRGGAPARVPLVMSPSLHGDLPVPVATERYEGRVVKGPEGVVRLSLVRPIGDARGRYAQQRLKLDPPRGGGLVRGVLMRSYFGETATDNGVSIQKELRRRGSDLPVYWAVQDHSVVVPEGGIPVVVNSREWYHLLSSVAYYVDNMYQPEYHRKPEGQVVVQTFHGYPFKVMGHPHWQNLQFSQARISAYDERARAWDYLVSPARYATPLLTRDFAYDGEVLEIGYPRNDVLLGDEADEIRRLTRESLGIAEGQTAVLYAPTFRDYLAENDSRAKMGDFFDFAAATRGLGDDVVILVRGHAFHARTRQRVGSLPGCVDVTDYPEVSDLYLAADAAVVDYSSLRFDFGVTGKPMVFHVPDLQRYKDTRGWLFDFEPTAPGPLVDTTEEVVECLRDLDGLRTRYRAAYDRFRADFLDLEDGHAGRRFVDRVFVPRGDA